MADKVHRALVALTNRTLRIVESKYSPTHYRGDAEDEFYTDEINEQLDLICEEQSIISLKLRRNALTRELRYLSGSD